MAVDFQTFQQEVIERLTELRGMSRRSNQTWPRTYKILHGNGQPGLISRITVIENNWGGCDGWPGSSERLSGLSFPPLLPVSLLKGYL